MQDRIGETYITNEGYKVVIIKYLNANNCSIKFDNGLILKERIYEKIKSGKVKNPYHPSVLSKGFIGEGDYLTSKKGKHTIAYSRWVDMLRRCYDPKVHEKHPTYKDCIVCNEWLNFQTFAKWFYENYIESWCLDKDILLKNNKEYSPKTCCFVPQELNKIILRDDKLNREYPIGVRKQGSKFQASFSNNLGRNYIGTYGTPEEAFFAYKNAKENYIINTANLHKDKLSQQSYKALINYNVEITD